MWGPAWLVMIADVDAASVITAAESGAVYGTKLIWFLLVLIVPLYVIQEVAGRVGAVTNKGLGELIRENYSRKTAILASVPMALVDIISYIVEYTAPMPVSSLTAHKLFEVIPFSAVADAW